MVCRLDLTNGDLCVVHLTGVSWPKLTDRIDAAPLHSLSSLLRHLQTSCNAIVGVLAISAVWRQARSGLSFCCCAALAHVKFPTTVGEANVLHELVDQEDSASVSLEHVSFIQGVCHGGDVESRAWIPNHDQYIARVVRDATLNGLRPIALATVAEGIGERFLQRQIDLELMPDDAGLDPSACSTPSITVRIAATSAGITMLNWHAEHSGSSALRCLAPSSAFRSSCTSWSCASSARSRSRSASDSSSTFSLSSN